MLSYFPLTYTHFFLFFLYIFMIHETLWAKTRQIFTIALISSIFQQEALSARVIITYFHLYAHSAEQKSIYIFSLYSDKKVVLLPKTVL